MLDCHAIDRLTGEYLVNDHADLGHLVGIGFKVQPPALPGGLVPPWKAAAAVVPASRVELPDASYFPDGGVAPLRLYGSLTEDGLAAAHRRWDETA